ncbi:MAG: DUF1254 domain-containing protein [Roseobacter sp.]|jgi:hypothetical protein
MAIQLGKRLMCSAGILAFLCTAGTADTPSYKMTTNIPPEITTPDSVDTSIGTLNFFDGVPDQATVSAVYDYVDRARAVQAFINMIPAVSMYHLRQGMRDIDLTGSNQIVIAEQLGDSKPLVLTWNNTSLYTWGFLDLATDGPTVVEVPPGVLGVFNDMYFRYIADIGAAGADKGQGGKYLVLPPGYEGDVPEGYFVVRSKTNGVWNFMRGYVEQGVEEATDRIKANLKVYPLDEMDNPPQMEFMNMSGLADYQTIPPNDFSFYEDLNALVQEEPVGWLDPETTGLLASIGIVKGQPFAPDARMKAILTDAVAIGNAYARANTVFPRDPDHRIYGPDSEWVMAFAGKDTYFLEDGARRMDSRLWMHYNAVVVTPAMALTKPGAGSDYGIAGLDGEGRVLDGSKTYRLTLPPDFPVKDNWSVTIYDTQTRSMLQTDQPFAGVNSLGEGVQASADGSYEILFAPEAPAGSEGNWIQTIPGKSWFIILRAYGPLEPWLDGSWRPSEIELVE